jgi:DNA modification methylase
MQVKESLFEYISHHLRFEMKNEDCLSVLKKTEDNKFDLVLTSPPYNVGKSYETKTSIEKYLETQEEIIAEPLLILIWQIK